MYFYSVLQAQSKHYYNLLAILHFQPFYFSCHCAALNVIHLSVRHFALAGGAGLCVRVPRWLKCVWRWYGHASGALMWSDWFLALERGDSWPYHGSAAASVVMDPTRQTLMTTSLAPSRSQCGTLSVSLCSLACEGIALSKPVLRSIKYVLHFLEMRWKVL